MSRSKRKILLPILCTVALLLCTVGTLLVSGGIVFPWRDKQITVDKILEEDGYLEGMWYPWFFHDTIGCNLTSNEYILPYINNSVGDKSLVGIDLYGDKNVYRDVYNMKAFGINMMAYCGSMYGEGVIFDQNGDVLGIKEEYVKNTRRLLDICRDVGMPVMWVVSFHNDGLDGFYDNGKYAWDLLSQMYCNPVVTEHYVDRFVRPLCQVLSEYPDVVVMVAATDEQENEMNDSDIGNHFEHRVNLGVVAEDMYRFVYAVNDALAEELPDVARTLCGNHDNFAPYSDMDLDMIGRSMYSNNAACAGVDTFFTAFPVIASEFGMGTVVTEEIFTLRHIQKRQAFMDAGYKGWFMWNWGVQGGGGEFDVYLRNHATDTDFRPMMYSLRYFIEDYRNEIRGVESVLDKPVLFYNHGGGSVDWIASRQAMSIDLLRSLDGGKTWEVMFENASPSEYEYESKGHYDDTTLPETGTVMYKVIARDMSGNEVESVPGNEAEILPPLVNLMSNGSFETGDLTDWIEWGDDSNIDIQVVKSDDAPEGDYMLRLTQKDGDWWGVHQDGIEVEPNKFYKLTFKYKMTENSTTPCGYVFLHMLDKDGNGTGDGSYNDTVLYNGYAGPTTEWNTCEMLFQTYGGTKMSVDLRVVEGEDMYIDDVQLTEVR
ncbi:MAG: carbohydrate binding domain-containing protein [Clostridia bacterium]|nr:carbohydrate binding domain-containing protein [Clostridia bacterium]